MADTVQPIKTSRTLPDLQRSVRIWEGKRAERLAQWRATTKKYKKTDPRRKQAWANYRNADQELKKARGKLLYRQQHKQIDRRQRCFDYAKSFANHTTESPPGSNRGGVITVWEQRLGSYLVGQPWCGTFAANMLIHAGVSGCSARMASVGLIEADAKAKRGPFKGWQSNARGVRRGDLVVLFGYGVHVAMVDRIDMKAGLVYTVEGNTSSGSYGSQANGGGVFTRARRLSDARGYALVRFPGE